MKYLLLLYTTPEARAEAYKQVPMQAWIDYGTALQDAGVFLRGDALQDLDTATTVRVRDGETLVTDGPFAETKEMLGGYYLIDVPDLDAALGWAAKLPNAGYGSAEVRPVMVYESVEA